MTMKDKNFLRQRDAGLRARVALDRPNRRRFARNAVRQGRRLRRWIGIAVACKLALGMTFLMMD
jgi:hypothetical protein